MSGRNCEGEPYGGHQCRKFSRTLHDPCTVGFLSAAACTSLMELRQWQLQVAIISVPSQQNMKTYMQAHQCSTSALNGICYWSNTLWQVKVAHQLLYFVDVFFVFPGNTFFSHSPSKNVTTGFYCIQCSNMLIILLANSGGVPSATKVQCPKQCVEIIIVHVA